MNGFAPNVPRAWKSFWAHPIVLLANVGQDEARFDPFGDNVNLGARKVLGFAPNVPRAWNRFGHTRMVLLGNGNLFPSVWR